MMVPYLPFATAIDILTTTPGEQHMFHPRWWVS